MQEDQEEELLPPPRPGSSAAAGSSDGRAHGKPAFKTFLPLEDDEDDTGIIPDEEQIRYGLTESGLSLPLGTGILCAGALGAVLAHSAAVSRLLCAWRAAKPERHALRLCAGEPGRGGSGYAARTTPQTTCHWRAAMRREAPKTRMLPQQVSSPSGRRQPVIGLTSTA